MQKNPSIQVNSFWPTFETLAFDTLIQEELFTNKIRQLHCAVLVCLAHSKNLTMALAAMLEELHEHQHKNDIQGKTVSL